MEKYKKIEHQEYNPYGYDVHHLVNRVISVFIKNRAIDALNHQNACGHDRGCWQNQVDEACDTVDWGKRRGRWAIRHTFSQKDGEDPTEILEDVEGNDLMKLRRGL